jgi:hypothetical protein
MVKTQPQRFWINLLDLRIGQTSKTDGEQVSFCREGGGLVSEIPDPLRLVVVDQTAVEAIEVANPSPVGPIRTQPANKTAAEPLSKCPDHFNAITISDHISTMPTTRR